MSITLNQLCSQAETKYQLRLVAGRDGLDHLVRWVHMVEDRDVPLFLHGHELVFTTGIGQKGNGWLLDFVKNLQKAQAAGLVVNIGPYIDFIPTPVITYCQENRFPLFTLPWEVRIIDISYVFCRRIIAAEENELTMAQAFRRILEGQDKRDSQAVFDRAGLPEEGNYTLLQLGLFDDQGQALELELAGQALDQIYQPLARARYPTTVFPLEQRLLAVRRNLSKNELRQLLQQLEAVRARLPQGFYLHIGVSDPGAGRSAWPRAYDQAGSALQVALMRQQFYSIYCDCGVYSLLFAIHDPEILRQFYSRTLGPLLDFDHNNHTDYLQTLRSYLEHHGSVQETALSSHVHRNTINNKMKAIKEILHTELTDEDRMNYLLAFHIANMESQRKAVQISDSGPF
ncbi:hypothetical protein HCH52_05985 [Oscillospiraceae bacterium HV4-5-C5C]|nr:hypothetical protein [Oscillospiraceae bacterium HV4-5-C5C]